MAYPRIRRTLSIAALAATAAAAASVASPAAADGVCTKFASPAGSDSAAGSEAAPYRTAQKLVNSLNPGDTGCLREGTYQESVSMRQGGTASARVTLRSFPGERAEIVGIFYLARTAPHVTVEGLWLNGRNSEAHPSLKVNATDAVFRNNDVTNDNTAICFILGHHDWGRAVRTVIEHNRIHHCGRLPATNFDHGIYVAASDDVRITNNWIHDNADWGVHLYPDAQRTLVEGNVIEGNGRGVTFSGEEGYASNDNVVKGNVISNSKIRFNVESWWPDGNPVPARNVASGNCLGPSKRDDYDNGGIETSDAFTASANRVVAEAGYADLAQGDLRLLPGGPCDGVYNGDNTVPGPNGGPGAALPPAAPRKGRDSEGSPRTVPNGGPAVTLTNATGRRAVRRGQRTRLRGRVAPRRVRPGLKVALVVRRRGARRAVAFATVRPGGRFTVRPRLSVRPGAVKLQAVVRGVGHSRSVRLRVRS